MKKSFVFLLPIVLVFLGFVSCNQSSVEADTKAPGAVTELNVASEDGKIVITWKDPADEDFYGAKIYTGLDENGALTYDKGVIVEKGIQEYSVSGLKNDGTYTFRVSAVDTSLNESAYVTSSPVVYKEKTVLKINNKFVCPECKTEYDTDEAAAACHGARVFYTVKLPAGTYKVYHLLQNLDFVNYHQDSVDESKSLAENSTIDDVKKNFTGFIAKTITYNQSDVYVYYNRKLITYTFNSGSQGGFIDLNASGTLFGKFGTVNTKTVQGYYGTIFPGVEKPKSDAYGFSKWNYSVPATFTSENLTFDAEWTKIADVVGSSSIYGADKMVMLSKDTVTTSLGKADINPFLMAKTEVTYEKWKEVIEWAKSNGYSCDVDFDDIGAAGSFITEESVYKDFYTDTEYTGDPDEEKTYTDNKFYDKENNEKISKEIKLNLGTGKRYFVENNQNVYFERGDSLVIFNDSDPAVGNKVKEKDQDVYISVSDLVSVDVSDYVLFEDIYNNNKIYLNKEKYITPNPFTGDVYIKPYNPSYEGVEYTLYSAEDENNNFIDRLVKSDISTTYTGTDIVFVDANGKYVRIKKEDGTIEECYLGSILPYIFGNSGKYVIKKANNETVEIEYKDFDYTKIKVVPDIVFVKEDASGKKYYLLDGNTKVYSVKQQNYYKFAMSYGTVYFTPWKGVEKTSDGGLKDRSTSEYLNDPVTRINWFMAVMWCNAASEKEGLTPVYYKPGTLDFSDTSNVIRDSSFTYNDSGVPAYCTSDIANAVINPAANGYRLPTEVEWEYAARGGDMYSPAWNYTYAGSNVLDDVAWCYENSGMSTHPVGLKAPNTAGLYDMSGNVFEFCWGPLVNDGMYYQIRTYVRGGSWLDPECFNHVDSRNKHQSSAMGTRLSVTEVDPPQDFCYASAQYNVGFRVVRSVIQ